MYFSYYLDHRVGLKALREYEPKIQAQLSITIITIFSLALGQNNNYLWNSSQ